MEEPGWRGDRRRAAQAARLRSLAQISAARGDPRRPDRCVARRAVHEHDLPGRRMGAARRPRARTELPRQRGLRREIPVPQRSQSRCRRRLGRPLGRRLADRQGLRRSGQGRNDGVEPGRVHLRVSHDARRGSLQGRLGRRRYFRLDDVLRQHRHPPVHAAVSEGDAVGRSGHLRQDLADHLHQAGEDADADSTRRHRRARAAAECVRAAIRDSWTTTCRPG